MDENPVNNGANMENNEVVRDEKGRVVSGCLNPKGKPEGSKHMTTLLREAIKKVSETKTGKKFKFDEEIIERVLALALSGDRKMIELIFNYMDGKPTQPIELPSDDGLWEKLAEIEKMVKKDDEK